MLTGLAIGILIWCSLVLLAAMRPEDLNVPLTLMFLLVYSLGGASLGYLIGGF